MMEFSFKYMYTLDNATHLNIKRKYQIVQLTETMSRDKIAKTFIFYEILGENLIGHVYQHLISFTKTTGYSLFKTPSKVERSLGLVFLL